MRNRTIAYFSLISALIAPRAIEAAPACREPIAKIASAQGQVDVKAYGNLVWLSINKEDSLCPGDALRTSRWSRATLSLKSGAVLTVDQNTTMSFSAPVKNDPSWFINLLEGSTFFRSRQPQRLDIQTPFINAVHKGTEFMVAVSGQQTEISVFDGQVAGENRSGKVTIDKGFKGIAEAGRPPRVQVLKITPEDAVQWMLYYPPIIDDSPRSQPAINSQVNAALTAYRLGDSNLALTKLDEIPVAQQDTRYLTLKAALLLTVGRVDEAQPLIQQAQHLQPNNSDAYALQAIIAVTKNQQQAALELANKSVIANPQSSVAKIAQSYAYQALFNIDQAFKATQEATRLTPDNALAWARLSELQLSQGDHDAALKSAQKAQTLNPKIARTQIILGFAGLAQTDIEDAKRAFEQALTIDSSDPLARLGLGLAKIRKGDLEEGKNELEIAVNLDPNNAVIRSYLGKAYYELRNKGYAGKEFEIAKEMDPKDPTPYFYDAILKQTTNRPVEALHDMQRAIELNDNRGVYRSKLLLDSDSAARSASLGRIYNDLGFQQRGLLEGWNSINQDPSNYSAHRLLADNYAALPRHEIARVSELLKAQLLQPVNITPVQPQAAESNILILDGLGSSITSFNEYNPLFTRNRSALQASGFYGSNDTLSDEVVQSGVWDRFSYSLGQFHYQTDGFRENNDLNKNSYNFFAQGSIAPNTNVQIELRHSDQKNGDISRSFFSKEFSPNKREQSENNILRAGLHHAFSTNSDLLMSLVYKNENKDSFDITDGTKIELPQKANGFLYELQHLFRHDLFDLTTGFGYLTQDGELDFIFDENPDPIYNFPQKIENNNFYLYSDLKPASDLTINLGLSLDIFDKKGIAANGDASYNTNQLNPKFGITWLPTKDTTLRFAAFRALKRSLIGNQTLEPTQIAGFNQFYDDYEGTDSARIGIGLDHKVYDNLLIGLEISHRTLDVLYEFNDTISIHEFRKTHWSENNARAYINWAPSPLFSASGDYQFEEFDRGKELIDQVNGIGATYLQTHRFKLTGNFFHSTGIISRLSLSYIDQTGNFVDPIFTENNKGSQSDRFWLLDAEVSYRLMKRHGFITVGIKNLLDEQFNYLAIDVNQPQLQQGRFLYTRLTLSF